MIKPQSDPPLTCQETAIFVALKNDHPYVDNEIIFEVARTASNAVNERLEALRTYNISEFGDNYERPNGKRGDYIIADDLEMATK